MSGGSDLDVKADQILIDVNETALQFNIGAAATVPFTISIILQDSMLILLFSKVIPGSRLWIRILLTVIQSSFPAVDRQRSMLSAMVLPMAKYLR